MRSPVPACAHRFGHGGRVASSILLLTLSSACSGGADPKTAKVRPPPLVSVTSVSAMNVPVEVHAPVDLRPIAQADVGSKTLGYLDAVLVDRGDRVHRGQLLAIVRPSDLPDQLEAARSALAQTQASLSLAKTNLERAKQLAPSGVVSAQELQQATSALAAAEAAEATAKSQIAVIATRLGETNITSPLDGVVSVRRLDPGALVGPPGGGAIVTVTRLDTLRVFITVNERDSPLVAVGQSAHVEVDALPGRSFFGHVVRLAPTFDSTTRTFEAEVQLANKSGELRPGMYGRGSIVLATHENAPVVPSTALVVSDQKYYVFVVSEDKVERRSVKIGVDAGTYLEVTAGLKAGERVVTAGADGLANGTKVRVSDLDPFTGKKTTPLVAATRSSSVTAAKE